MISKNTKQIAMRLYNLGDMAGAFEAAAEWLEEAPHDLGCWALLGRISGRTGHAALFLSLLARLSSTDEQVAVAVAAWNGLVIEGFGDCLADFEHELSKDHPLWPVLVYFIGCNHVANRRTGEALARFEQFRRVVAGNNRPAWFRPGGAANVLFRQGTLVRDRIETMRRLAPPPPLTPKIQFVGPMPGQSEAVVLSTCNGLYFEAFGERFVAEASSAYPHAIHVHVIAPGPDTAGIMERLRGSHGGRLGFSVEDPPAQGGVTYFACNRFFVADGIMAAYGAPVLCLDLDIALGVPADHILAACAGADFACMTTSSIEPAAVYLATIMYWAPTARSLAFLTALRHYCAPDLSRPSDETWMLDQAALYSLMANSDLLPSGFRRIDLTEHLRLPWERFIRPLVSDEEKAQLRNQGLREHG